MQIVNSNKELRAKDIVYGHSNQYHRNVPIVLSNIILKYFNNTYHINNELKIKDILLPKFNFTESIVIEIGQYLSFEQCETCNLITWPDGFDHTQCYAYCSRNNYRAVLSV